MQADAGIMVMALNRALRLINKNLERRKNPRDPYIEKMNKIAINYRDSLLTMRKLMSKDELEKYQVLIEQLVVELAKFSERISLISDEELLSIVEDPREWLDRQEILYTPLKPFGALETVDPKKGDLLNGINRGIIEPLAREGRKVLKIIRRKRF